MSKRSFEADCTVEVSHTFDSLYARVDLDGGYEFGPADSVIVHGDPINPPYGEVVKERRRATVTRATWFAKMRSRFVAHFKPLEFMELSFSSFSDGELL